MPQSLAKVYLHLIFSTKHRERLIPPQIRPELHRYMGGILRELECNPVEINSEPDHAHVLFTLSRTEPISTVVGHLKKGSNDWLRRQGTEFSKFHWQAGYGVFSVSQSAVEEVREYIRTQEAHHGKLSFQEELRAFLRRYGLEFDEQYVWD